MPHYLIAKEIHLGRTPWQIWTARSQQLPIAIWLWVKCLGIPELDGSLNIIKYWICFRSSSVEGPIRVWSPFQSSGQIVLFYGWMFGFTTLPLPYHRTLIRRPVMTCTNITWPLTHTRTQKSQSVPCASIQTPEITSPSILPQVKRAERGFEVYDILVGDEPPCFLAFMAYLAW